MSARSDDFNRTDSSTSLGTPSDGGAGWTTYNSSTWGISSNQAYCVTSGPSNVAVATECSAANGAVQATLSTKSSGVGASGLVARLADGSNYILFQANTSDNTGRIYKKVSGGFTQIASAGAAWAAGDVVKGDCSSGNVLTLYRNGSSVTNVTDSAGSTNTKAGMYCSDSGSSPMRIDDWSWADAGGATLAANPMRGGGTAANPMWGFL